MTPQGIIYINMITFESYLDSICTYIDKITISGKKKQNKNNNGKLHKICIVAQLCTGMIC